MLFLLVDNRLGFEVVSRFTFFRGTAIYPLFSTECFLIITWILFSFQASSSLWRTVICSAAKCVSPFERRGRRGRRGVSQLKVVSVWPLSKHSRARECLSMITLLSAYADIKIIYTWLANRCLLWLINIIHNHFISLDYPAWVETFLPL